MQILSSKQIHEADSFTILNEPISSLNLMERASEAFVKVLLQECEVDINSEFWIICGKGNNGGDGLAVARLLAEKNYQVSVVILDVSANASADFTANQERLQNVSVQWVSEFQPIQIPQSAVIIDAILGSGLNRILQGFVAEFVEFFNALPNRKISIDVPSGLFTDEPTPTNAIVFHANHTISFHAPKLQFLFAENNQFVGTQHIADIKLLVPPEILSPYNFTQASDVHLKKRNEFSHKGSFGHALLIAGSFGKIGAAILASRACLKSGCGLLTTAIPQCGYQILQTAVPEAMAWCSSGQNELCNFPNSDKFSAVGIGVGIGTEQTTIQAFKQFLIANKKPLILDADAINILATNPDLWEFVPQNAIITPHPAEFDRITHKHSSGYERFCTQIEFAKQHTCIVVLKGHFTSVANPCGQVFFNSTGNAGMATAGSGDVLTGIILSLLSQNYEPFDAAVFGVFLHGLAGDCYVHTRNSLESLTASDIVNNISKAQVYVSKN